MEKLTYKKILDAIGNKDISLVFEMRGKNLIMRMEDMPKASEKVFDGIKTII